jgi:hypothetical protein
LTGQSKKRLNSHISQAGSTSRRTARQDARITHVSQHIRACCAMVASFALKLFAEKIAALPEKIAAIGKVPH